MNNAIKKAQKIQTNRIGATCFFDAITCSLEYLDRIYWALDYVDYTFLFNKEKILSFHNVNELDSQVSPTDKYYFYISPNSAYYADLLSYTSELYITNIGKMVACCTDGNENFFNTLESLDESKLPVILKVNNLEYKEFYAYNHFTIPRSDSKHLINILAVSKNKDKFFIFDRGFDCFGEWIDPRLLFRGATSNFLGKSNEFCYMFFHNTPPKLNQQEIKAKLKSSIMRAMPDIVEIDGTPYKNNHSALASFKRDMEEIINVLYAKYGHYAAPLLGEAILLQVDGSMGISNLYEEINKILQLDSLPEVIYAIKLYWEEWHKFEQRLKYITYKNENIFEYINVFENRIEKMMDLDNRIMYGLNKVIDEI
ncbi:hypothetical protein ACPW7J_02320 [Ihubacter sp. rT4E-8]|uniref:hypothetical protein n=1 Tax=Ihubacter sp. rT4E-8 TaxID=3242369 RepID=UPI003CF40BB6